jgi:hypothetical protein
VRRWVVLVLVAAVAAAAFVWWRSDRRRLVARWTEAQELIEKSGPEGQLDAFARVRGVVGLFAPGFVVFARPYEGTISDAQQLAAILHAYRDSAERIEISDSERRIELHPERGTADLEATVDVIGLRGGSPGRERFRVRVAWREDGGVWRIQELEIVEVLETTGFFF